MKVSDRGSFDKDSVGLTKLASVMMEGFKNMQHSFENLAPTIAHFVTEEFQPFNDDLQDIALNEHESAEPEAVATDIYKRYLKVRSTRRVF